jgi:hypothetical protein
LIRGNGNYRFIDSPVSSTTQYYYKIGAVDLSGDESLFGPVVVPVLEALPTKYRLLPNVPNPFNPTTDIAYDVPRPGGHVRIDIYNPNGQLVRSLVDRTEQPGRHIVTWHGKDEHGSDVASGVYFCRLESQGLTKTRSLVLLR